MEDIAASFAPDGDGTITSDAVNEFLNSEVAPLSDIRARRRKLMEAQEKCDDVKRAVCDKVEEKTPKPLHERIMELRDTDKELYDYIWQLRALKYGIWCAQCEQAKNIGGRNPEDVQRDVEAESQGKTPDSHAVKKHIPLSKDNRVHAALMSPAAQEKTLSLHGPKAIPGITQQQIAALPPSLRKHVAAAPALTEAPKKSQEDTAYQKAQAVYPPAPACSAPAAINMPAAAPDSQPLTLPQHILDKLPQQVAALVSMRDQIGAQLSQVDAFIGSLSKFAAPAEEKTPAAAAADDTTTKFAPTEKNAHETTSYTVGVDEDVADTPTLDDIINSTLDEYDEGDDDCTF